ncbi:histidine phosphatase superfamily [Coniella lustricola]|uniref:Histidine phosphatase superfamily n=1 Tax=Coniella lustricola TaxID=2025994 RepID=A0A2T3ANH9_9PEZI|nr:histidine phosphatase superfamily [Coniella lustricola]
MNIKSIQALLALLAGQTTAETTLGVYIFHRHGDRTSKSWPPTTLTALGADQVYTSASWFRKRYIASNSTNPILNQSPDLAKLSQLSITAPVDNVLQSSAIVFTQGIYPPAGTAADQTLANGDSTQAPFDGYQYIPVNIVTSATTSTGSEDSEWLQGSSGCANAVASSNEYLQSQEYLNLLNQTGAFYQGLLPVYNTTFTSKTATYQNAYTIFDYVHVSQIHNQTIPSANLLTNDTTLQLQTLANAHEWGLAYNESDPVRAIAGAVLAGQILQTLNTTLNAPLSQTSAERFTIQFGAYGAFMSFFGLANLTAASDDFRGIVDYASSITFELVTNATVSGSDAPATVDPDDVSVRFLFVNGTASDANVPQVYPLFGQSETTISWNDFAAGISNFSIDDTMSWCQACGNTTGVCASASSSGSGSGSAGSGSTSSKSADKITPGVAAGIGILSLFGVILLIGIAAALAGFRVVRKGSKAATDTGSNGATSPAARAYNKTA